MTYAVQLAGALLGSLGFSLLFNVRGKRLYLASLGGLLSWGTYLLMSLVTESEAARYLASSVVLTLYAEVMAHVMRSPATVFLVSGTIPLIPGGMLYSTMRCAVAEQWDEFFAGSLTTLMLAASIAGGILFAMTVLSIIRKLKRMNSVPIRTEKRKKGGGKQKG